MSNFGDDEDDDREIRFRRHDRYGTVEGYLRDFNRWRSRAGSGRTIALLVAALVIALTLFNTLYQVQPEEVGVVVRFGKYMRTTEPGLRAKVPFLEQVYRIPVQRQLKEEFGFRTNEPGARRHRKALECLDGRVE